MLADLAIVFLVFGAVFRSWRHIPQAVRASFASGGFWRGLRLMFRGKMEKQLPAFQYTPGGTRIHFLATGASDAILLESDGHFALIDAAEDYDNPKNKPTLQKNGFEQYVLDYVRRVAGGRLDWVLGTHSHSDHLGGFDTLILAPDIRIGQAYLKPYLNENKCQYEKSWDNQEVYDQMAAACRARGVPLIQENLDGMRLTLGEMELTSFNGELHPSSLDENDNSIGLLVQCRGSRAFLAGDICNVTSRESLLGPKIGPVDLLKCGHHGYEGSSTMGMIVHLMPKDVVVCNSGWRAYPTVKRRFVGISNSRLMATADLGGIAAEFTNEGLRYFAIGEFPKGPGGAEFTPAVLPAQQPFA
ncbi:MAG: MBL fold metallo-hydrolase [Oscillospiraceae bacterium]|jgi:beta-lactamase superfamily II metal-dependent hydrolase|nr:MBL fold metallo-hydrolase [Oscillospiraceae bacterium]